MKFHVVTLFPEMFEGPTSTSIIGRSVENGLIEIQFVNPRDFTTDRHRTADAPPYGGGPGMVMMAPPLASAVDAINSQYTDAKPPTTVLMSPQGKSLTHRFAEELAKHDALTLVCGHYEGVDERFIEQYVDIEMSVGDFVMTGGEIPAMAVIDAVARLVPKVLGDAESVRNESFATDSGGILEGPVYTRPAVFRGSRVPEVLLTGNRHEIETFRKRAAADRTLARRPDLMEGWGPVPDCDQ